MCNKKIFICLYITKENYITILPTPLGHSTNKKKIAFTRIFEGNTFSYYGYVLAPFTTFGM